jgi:GxxExxY protein
LDERTKLDLISRRIIGAAIEVRRTLGPGLLESACQACLAFELRQLDFKVEEQKALPVVYKEVKLDCGYRIDLVVDDIKDGMQRILNEFADSAISAVHKN